MNKTQKQKISLGTIVMLTYSVCLLVCFALLLPSFTGNHDILFDAARIAVAMDDSLSQLSASAPQFLPSKATPHPTIVPPFSSHSSSPIVTPSPSPTVSPKRSFSLCAAGSVELNSDVRKALTINKDLRYDLLTDQIPQVLKADLSIATLCNTVSTSNKLSSINMEAALLTALRRTGINVLNLLHVNSLNYGLNGLNETIDAVTQADFTPLGVEANSTFMLNGVQIDILHYQDKISSTGQKQTSKSERTFLRPIDPVLISNDITALRANGSQVVIITLWWGDTGKDTPSAAQKEVVQTIADAGADIILGTGNGALQPVQILSANRGDGKYHPVLCAYSLGNLFSPNRESRTTLASLFLKTNVVYDIASGTVAFENLTYTPTYAWRGKDEGKTIHRILINNPIQLPSFVDANQQGVMERCLTLVNTLMADTAIPLAY